MWYLLVIVLIIVAFYIGDWLLELYETDAMREAKFGVFVPEVPKTIWATDDSNMVLLDQFSFVPITGPVWTAIAGTVTNGASIPRLFWTLAGAPLNGPYRRAAVIHDYLCTTHLTTWQETHSVFHTAMRAEGTGPIKAQLLYWAVYCFGPKW